MKICKSCKKQFERKFNKAYCSRDCYNKINAKFDKKVIPSSKTI